MANLAGDIMKDKGYEQTVQNIAYEIWLLGHESVIVGESTEEMLTKSLSDPKRLKQWTDIDKIMFKACEIYDVSIDKLQEDVDAETRVYILKAATNL